MIGKTISHYRILEKLGEGGMGVVYKAEDTHLKRTVALKFLSPQALGGEEEESRFIHEARSAAALDHPSICTVYEVNKAEEHTFIAMAYVEGRSLKGRIESGPLKLDEAVDIAIQVAEGLQEAHEKGTVHRDIKPANIMVTPKDQAKIMDFGLAKAPDRTKLTKTGMTLGTAAYMSPEQARGGEIDSRTDIWSLGAVLYEMVTGQGPFKGDYEQAVMYSILNESPEPLTALRTGVPMDLERIVNKALAKRPDERYQHMGEILVDLRLVRKTLEPGAVRPRPIEEGVSRRKRVFLYGGIVVVLALVLMGRSYFFQEGGEPIDSIAVLPLENLSGDRGEDYFVAGMHEALITDLSKVSALRVISRTSVLRYKETDKQMSEIARELGVDALVEGSVLRVGDQVRITAQLIHGVTDEHLWAESYDRDLRNVLALLSEVAHSIVGEIEVVLTDQEEEHLIGTGPVNPDAHDAFLKGQHSFETYEAGGLGKALVHFQKAIDIDPSFAPAWAWLSATYAVLAGFGLAPIDEAMPKAKTAALKAIELDDRLSVAHTALGWARFYAWDWSGAEVAFRKALELNPNDAWPYHGYGDYLTVMGRLEEGLRQVMRGRECDPFSPLVGLTVAGHLYMLRLYDESIEEARRVLEINPDTQVHGFVARSLWQKGMYEKAIEAWGKTSWGRDAELMRALKDGHARSGPEGGMLSVAELWAARSDTLFVDPMDVAFAYARAGQVDLTFEWLERAFDQRSPLLWHFAVYPDFELLRSDPRFHDLLTRLGLPKIEH